MPVEQRKQLTVADVKQDALFQVRAGAEWDKAHCESIQETIREAKGNESIPPLHVLVLREAERGYPKGCQLLVGGHYRLEAAKLEKWPKIWAIVREGTWFDAFRWSRGENRGQPKNRTQNDVRHAAFQAFDLRKREPRTATYQDKDIAEDIGVTKGRISQLKKEWASEFNLKPGGAASPGASAGSGGASSGGPSGSGGSSPGPPADPIEAAVADGEKNRRKMEEETADDPAERAVQVGMLKDAALEELAALTMTYGSLGLWDRAAAYVDSLKDLLEDAE